MNKTIVNDSYTGMSSLNATVHLKVTPLKGRIDKLSVGFTFFRTNEVPPYKLIDRVAGGTINTEEAFSKAIEVSSELNVTSRDLPGWTRSYVDYISQTSSESFKKECKIDMDITELTVEGQKLTWDALYAQKPNEVYAYKELRDKGDRSSSSYKYNRNTFIKNYIDRSL